MCHLVRLDHQLADHLNTSSIRLGDLLKPSLDWVKLRVVQDILKHPPKADLQEYTFQVNIHAHSRSTESPNGCVQMETSRR